METSIVLLAGAFIFGAWSVEQSIIRWLAHSVGAVKEERRAETGANLWGFLSIGCLIAAALV